MSQIKFDKPLEVNLKFSKQHKIFLCLVHAFAIIMLLLPFELHVGIKLALIGYVVYSLIYIFNKTRRGYTGSLISGGENIWLWLDGSSKYKLEFRYGIILFSRLVLLTFVGNKGKHHYWLLFPDSNDKEIFRKIRIFVRHSTAETISPPV